MHAYADPSPDGKSGGSTGWCGRHAGSMTRAKLGRKASRAVDESKSSRGSSNGQSGDGRGLGREHPIKYLVEVPCPARADAEWVDSFGGI